MANGGAVVAALPGQALSAASLLIQYLPHGSTSTPNIQGGQWRPPQWKAAPQTSILVPPTYAGAGVASVPNILNGLPTTPSSSTGVPNISNGLSQQAAPTSGPTLYVFDCVARVRHSRRARPTSHPIQTGANVADHVLLMPAELSMDIVMSDVAQAYAAGMWVGNPSKSISAYQILKALQAARIPLTVATRLETYQNMIITDVPNEDTVRSQFGLRATILFEQIFVANVATQTVSARPQTTGSTALGTVQAAPPPAAVPGQYALPAPTPTPPQSLTPDQIQKVTGFINASGNYSSNPTSSMSTAFSPSQLEALSALARP